MLLAILSSFGVAAALATSAAGDSQDNETSLTVRLIAASNIARYPSEITVRLNSAGCAIERAETVTQVTGQNQVEFAGLPAAECRYDVETHLPVGWSEPTRDRLYLGAGESRTIGLTYIDAPDNDRIASATVIADERISTITTPAAPSGRDDSSCGSVNALWYKWTAPADGEFALFADEFVTFDVQTSNQENPTSINDLDLLGCNYGVRGVGGEDRFSASAGETYWIGVASNFDVTFHFHFFRAGCVGLTATAADGELSGAFELNDAGFAGTEKRPGRTADYAFDPDSPDAIDFCVEVNRPGTYYLWAEIAAADRNSDSFWVVIDDGEPQAVYSPSADPLAETYLLDNDDQRIALTLGEGAHSVRFVRRETGASLARFELRPVRTAAAVPSRKDDCKYNSWPVDVNAQAELASTTGSMLAQNNSDGLSGAADGGYVGVPSWVPNEYTLNPTDVLDICFADYSFSDSRVRYQITARVLAPSEAADSFFVQVGYDMPFVWHVDPALTWQKQTIHVPGTSDPYEFVNGEFEFQVRIFARESGTLLDWIRVETVGPDYSSYPSYSAKPKGN